MSKYHNRRVTADGYSFGSQAEHRRYEQLMLIERAGEISGLVVHPRYVICPKTATEPQIVYEGDFEYLADGRLVCEDVKGVRTAVYVLKASLFRRIYDDRIEFREIDAKEV